MDKIKILAFLSGYGNGYGDGNGDGYGNGYGNGYGYGNGDGNGYGNGYGYGNGDGNGYGYGNGDGDGYGNGDGNGDGYGYGNGDGNGYGYGNGDGNGYGYGDGLKIAAYKGQPVYYVDNIPCVFLSIKGRVAKVGVIDVMSFQTTEQYIYKFNGMFAHGLTIEKAKQDAERKYYSSIGVEDGLELFTTKFKRGVKYNNGEFYNWHTILTGSCDSGKDMFIKQHGIDLNKQMTPEEFISLTKDAYGGQTISRIKLK